jgi:glutamine synthetase
MNVYDLTEETREKLGIEMLPGSLFEALLAFESDQVIQGALGESLTGAFLKSRYAEWEDFRTHVTDWELNRYLTTA